MRHARHGLLAALLPPLLGGLGPGLAPDQAQALSDILFYVTNRGGPVCVRIVGPWYRDSGLVGVDRNATDILVYSAAINEFSPYAGTWSFETVTRPGGDCTFLDADGITTPLGEQIGKATFCAQGTARDQGPPTGTLTVDASGKPAIPSYLQCRGRGGAAAAAAAAARGGVFVVAAAHLGHEPTPGAGSGTARRGSDHFRFEGQAGDTVELALERDGALGSTGELARLGLRREDGAVLGRREGAVPSEPGAAPLALTATLPAAGGYVIEVAEVASGPGGGEPFRGHYRLWVSSTSGKALLLEPFRSVEP